MNSFSILNNLSKTELESSNLMQLHIECPICEQHITTPELPPDKKVMGIGIVLALLATQAQTAALAHSVQESQTELMKKRMQTLFPMMSS